MRKIFLRKKSTVKEKSVLGNQKITAREKRHQRWANIGKIGVAAGVAGGVIFLCKSRATNFISLTNSVVSAVNVIPSQWQVDIVDASMQPHPDEVRKEISQAISRILKTGSPQELHAMKNAIEDHSTFDNVSVLRVSTNQLVVQTTIRKPLMKIVVGNRLRYLSISGAVFGDDARNGDDPEAKALTLTLSGIFEPRSAGFQDEKGRLATSEEEKHRLLSAIDLQKKLISSGLTAKSMEFQRFRGFKVVNDDGLEMVIGVAPFEYKIAKLKSLLDGLKQSNTVISRIEIDYDGKAFIKQKKL